MSFTCVCDCHRPYGFRVQSGRVPDPHVEPCISCQDRHAGLPLDNEVQFEEFREFFGEVQDHLESATPATLVDTLRDMISKHGFEAVENAIALLESANDH